MRDLIVRWWYHPARPWEFWYPGSGLSGGIIVACIAWAIYAGVVALGHVLKAL